LRALGIGQILARSPQARGRSERAFGTIQGRLPQELRLNGITNYADASRSCQTEAVWSKASSKGRVKRKCYWSK